MFFKGFLVLLRRGILVHMKTGLKSHVNIVSGTFRDNAPTYTQGPNGWQVIYVGQQTGPPGCLAGTPQRERTGNQPSTFNNRADKLSPPS